MSEFHVYIIAYDQGGEVRYYTGYTGNPLRRFKAHVRGYGAKCLRGKRILGIKIICTFQDPGSAMMRERFIKSFPHDRKGQLFSRGYRA